MANISKIITPDGTSYDIRDAYKSGIYTVKGTQNAKTGSWTGSIDVDALYDGLTIAYYLPYDGNGNATLNLTLKGGGTTGAVNCYYNNSRLNTQYPAGSTIVMTYWSVGSVSISGTEITDNRWCANADYYVADTMNSRSLNIYNTIEGSSDPEAFADDLIRSFRLNARTV